MSTEKDLQELSNVSSSHFPDRSSKWLIRQREHLYALLQMLASQIADALDFNRVEQVHRSFISDELRTQESDMEAYTRAILYLFLLILHRREADEHQDLLRILTQEHTQNQEIVNMAGSIIELSEQRGEQRGIQQGIEQGARRTSIESTLAILNTRFSDADIDTLTPMLEAIEDLNRLKQLNLEASLVESFGAFQECLEA